MLEWQHRGGDVWVLGSMVRGIVRDVVAEVYLDMEMERPWVWFTHGARVFTDGRQPDRGNCGTFLGAVEAVEGVPEIRRRFAGLWSINTKV